MALDLNKALLLPFLSVLALSFPCRAAAWPPGRNLSVVTAGPLPPCDAGGAGCRIADLRPELEGMADPGVLGASLATGAAGPALDRNSYGCGRRLPSGRYTPCTPPKSRPPRCDVHCRTRCPC